MLLESSQGWMLSSWLPGSTVYLHKEIISLSPQYTQYKLYSFLPSILGVEYFADLIEALMMGLWCWKQDSSTFPRPRGAWKQGGLEVSQPLSCPLTLHTHSPARLLVNCGGKVRGGVGKATMQMGMISTKRSFPGWLPWPLWVWTRSVHCPFSSHLPSDSIFIMLTLSLDKSLKD